MGVKFMLKVKSEIVIDAIEPEWLRREIIEAISDDKNLTLSMYHGKEKLWEYPIVGISNTDKKMSDTPLLMPRIKVFKLKDNHISILESIRGDVKILMKNKDDYNTKIILRDYRGESLFITLPEEWIGNEIVVRYDGVFPEGKIIHR